MKNNKFLLQHLLRESLERHPQRTAIIANNQSISYKELDDKSSKLANLLLLSGFKPKDVIALFLPKSVKTVVSMLAVLKAGGAYIPLDSHYSPISRIHKIIEKSGVNYIITTKSQWDELLDYDEKEQKNILLNKVCIFIDSMEEDNNNKCPLEYERKHGNRYLFYNNDESSELIMHTPAISEDLAYILYTSGSTGISKGVMLSHLNAMTFINWSLSCFKPNCEDIFSNFAPLHFDLSVFDIYVSIASGACVTMVPYDIMSNPRAIVKWAEQQKVSIWYSVPSIWISILRYAIIEPGDLQNLKYILFAGEVFPPKFLKLLMKSIPHAYYYNLYGPTETNVCMYHFVKSVDEVTDRPVPIGIACENTDILVLNKKDEPVSVGEESEVLVRGPIVTKGYYKYPDLTNRSFITSPLPEHNGIKFYKTSDIVKKNRNGIYEYIGRKDLMVKCAGFRIELQEIEYAFYQNENVEEAVVVPYSDTQNEGGTKLYAMIKPKKKEQFSIIDTKKQLSKILPKYMIPEYIECVEGIQKNANGKVDRFLVTQIVKEKLSIKL